MSNRNFHCLFLLFISLSILPGQDKVQTITLKKGEVLDILLISQNDDVEEDLKAYFQLAFPVAKGMSYQPQPGFKITGLVQGNHQPNSLILGKWESLEKREAFLVEIEKELTNFHERRQTIWSYFGLQYFELSNDHTLVIDRGKFHVATAFWCNDEKMESNYISTWISKIESSGGEQLIALSNGVSPNGYYYGASHYIITAWESQEAFATFQKGMANLERDNIYHLNEITIQ